MENLSTKCVVVKKEVIAISALLQRKKKKWWGFSVKSQCYKGWKPCITWTVINLFIWKFLGLNWWWLFNTAFIIILKNGTKTGTTCETDTMSTCIGTIKLKKGKSKCCSQIKKILQIDIKNVGGAVIYSKDISGFFVTKKKNPKKWGRTWKKVVSFFFCKKEKNPMFSVVQFVPPFPISFKEYLVKFLSGRLLTKAHGIGNFYTIWE